MESEHPSLSEVGEKVRQDFGMFREAVQRETDELTRNARAYVEQHPYAAVGAAFGIGFLLAGGLFSKMTARTLKFGTRFLVGRALRQLIAGAGAGMAFPSSSSTHQER
jgi:hypothetical protein